MFAVNGQVESSNFALNHLDMEVLIHVLLICLTCFTPFDKNARERSHPIIFVSHFVVYYKI